MAFDSLSARLNKTMQNIIGKGKLTDANKEGMLKEVRLALLEADVNYRVVKDFLNHVRDKARGEDVLNSVEPGEMLVKIVHDEIISLLGEERAELNFKEDGMTIIMMVGLQGTGKTTSAAKIARLCKTKYNRKPMLIAADIIRPAAIDQLKTLGASIDTEVFSLGTEVPALETAKQGVEYAKTKGYDTVLIDTAGRLHIDEALMAELQQIRDAVEPAEILLVVDAMTGQDAVNAATAFDEALGVTGVMLTKLDGDARGGAALSIRAATGKPIKFIGTGEKLDMIEPFHPDRMASRILGMGDVLTLIEKAEQSFDQKKAAEAAEKLLSNRFTLTDYLDQMNQLKGMGDLESLAGMIPGMDAKALKGAKMDEKALARQEAIILSMTQGERDNPAILNSSRKKRIAAGSGTQVVDVNRLIKQFEAMQQMMKQLSGKNMRKLQKKMGKMGGGFPGMGGGFPGFGF
jgi:signal recognition particle subunit SRP54